VHSVGSAKLFGLDKFSTRKHYFQCLLALEQLRIRGLGALPSGQSAWYYRAVLAAEVPAVVPRGLSVKGYRALVSGCGQDSTSGGRDRSAGAFPADGQASGDDSDSSEAIISVALPASLRTGFLSGAEDSTPLPPSLHAGRLRGQGVESQAEVTAGLLRATASSSSSSLSAGSDSGVTSQSGAGFALGGQSIAAGVPRPPVNDCIKVEEHLRPGMPGHYRRYTTVCPLARTGHCAAVACGKRRNCGQAQLGRLGPAAPEAFLMVWRAAACSFADKVGHQRWSPTEAEVRRFMVEQGWL